MTVIETPLEAECGAAFGGSPEALRFQDVRFPIGRQDYVVDMPVRGNKTVSSYVARLKLQSEPAMSSYHRFSVAAKFADGSIKQSKPVSFFFLKPPALGVRTRHAAFNGVLSAGRRRKLLRCSRGGLLAAHVEEIRHGKQPREKGALLEHPQLQNCAG